MKNQHILFIHILIALATALILYICMKPVLTVFEPVLVTDAVTSGCILSVLFFFLKSIVKYGHFSSLLFRQRLVNYSALGLLFIACWLGSGYIILYISFPADEWSPLLLTLPIRIVIAVLIYSIIIFAYSGAEATEEMSEQEEEPDYDHSKDEMLAVSAGREEAKPTEIIERIAVKNGQKIDVIMIHEIICILAEGDYVMIHTEKGRFLKEQTMKSLENALPPNKFVRVHRSSIVNVTSIAQIELYNKQNQLLKLKNGIQVKVSLTGYRALKNTLGL